MQPTSSVWEAHCISVCLKSALTLFSQCAARCDSSNTLLPMSVHLKLIGRLQLRLPVLQNWDWQVILFIHALYSCTSMSFSPASFFTSTALCNSYTVDETEGWWWIIQHDQEASKDTVCCVGCFSLVGPNINTHITFFFIPLSLTVHHRT